MTNNLQDNFIESLVKDLKPQKPLNNIFLWTIFGLALLALSALVLASIGPRSDFETAVQSGTIIWKNGGLFIGAIASLAATIALSRPDTKPKIIVPALFVLIFIIIVWRIIELSRTVPIIDEMTNINFGGAQYCVPTIFIGGALVYTIVWHLWLRRTASNHPQYLGASAGLMSALIAGCAYSFHCNMDSIFYYIACYWLPAFSLALLGYFMGKKLKW